MRRQINKRTRIGVLILCITLAMISAYNLYSAHQQPTIVRKNITALNYEQKGDIDYKVYLKPNSLYEESVLGPGRVYFTNLIDRIDASSRYEFISDKPVEIEGVYQIIADIKSEGMWEKSFVLVPETRFNSEGESASFEKSFPIDLARFERVVKLIEGETGVTAREPKLTINCEVHTVARTSADKVKESLSPNIAIPLNRNFFTINGKPSDHMSDSLKKTAKIFQQSVVNRRRYSLIALAIFLASFMGLMLGTKSKPSKVDIVGKEVSKTRKKYKDRIAEAKERAPAKEETVISLSSLEDLIRVADELGKPVIHHTPSIPGEPHAYWVFDDSTRYEYLLGYI